MSAVIGLHAVEVESDIIMANFDLRYDHRHLRWSIIYNFFTRVKDLHGYNVKVAGWGDRFEFGTKRTLVGTAKGTYEDPSRYSSCMTTHESPVDARFKYCDTEEV